jgi:hypothetical protein
VNHNYQRSIRGAENAGFINCCTPQTFLMVLSSNDGRKINYFVNALLIVMVQADCKNHLLMTSFVTD